MIQKDKYKFILQKYDYDCGVAAVATLLLNSSTHSVDYEKLTTRLGTNNNGTDFDDIEKFLLGKKVLDPRLFYGASLTDLKKEIKSGRIAIILYQGWGNAVENAKLLSGHYAIVVGYENGKIYLLDPSVYENWGDGIGWRIIDDEKFKKKWKERDNNKLIKGWMISVKPLSAMLE